MPRRLLVLSFVLFAVVALAGGAELLATGELAVAWQAGAQSNDPAELAAAAEAASLMAQYRASSDDERRLWLERTEQAARRLIELFPDDPEGYYQLAHAQAEMIRFVGIFGKIGLASAIKENLDACLERDPRHARALMGLALWNMELAQRGLGWLYGARLEEVRPLLQRAVELKPGSIEIRKNYGFAMIKLRDWPAARAQLQKTLSLPARNVADRLHQQRAAELLEHIP